MHCSRVKNLNIIYCTIIQVTRISALGIIDRKIAAGGDVYMIAR